MAAQDRRFEETESRKTLIIVVAVAAAVVIALFFALLMWSSADRDAGEPRLAGAIRAGTAEFEPYKSQIVLDDPSGNPIELFQPAK